MTARERERARAGVFFDTNVLVYAEDPRDETKRHRARELIRNTVLAGTGVVSMQVLNELAAVSLRKLGLDADAVRRRIELYARLRLVPTEAEDLIAALEIHRVHGFSWWNCLVLQAAKRAGCRVLYSEDLQHGFRLGTLEVVDPFRSRD